MHGFDADTEALGEAILTYAEKRMRLQPVPLDGPKTFEELQAVAGETITAEGMGGLAALKLFGDELAKACLSNDHPRYLSFIPCAPTEAAAMFDLVVGASGIYAASWLEAAQSSPRTQRCGGLPTWPGCHQKPAACSSPVARSATCQPW